MSSYFDQMNRAFHSPTQLVYMARDQYRTYLTNLQREVLVKDATRLNILVMGFDQKFSNDALGRKGANDLGLALEDMHDFAHQVGSARIRLKGGRVATDNPCGFY